MARAFSEGTDKHPPRSLPPSWSARAPPWTRADHPGVRLSLEVPASRLAKGSSACSPTPCARRPSPPARSEPGPQPPGRDPRTSWPPTPPAGPPRNSPSELFLEDLGMSRVVPVARRRRFEKIDAAARSAFYDRHMRPATFATRGSPSATLTGTGSDALLGDTLGAWTGTPGEPRPVPPVTARTTPAVWSSWTGSGAVQTQPFHRPDRPRPARPGAARPGARQVTARRHPHLPAWTGRPAREEKGWPLYGVRPSGRSGGPRRTARGGAMLAISGPARGHAEHRPGAGRPVGRCCGTGGGGRARTDAERTSPCRTSSAWRR